LNCTSVLVEKNGLAWLTLNKWWGGAYTLFLPSGTLLAVCRLAKQLQPPPPPVCSTAAAVDVEAQTEKEDPQVLQLATGGSFFAPGKIC
jgi:hypothetical protein